MNKTAATAVTGVAVAMAAGTAAYMMNHKKNPGKKLKQNATKAIKTLGTVLDSVDVAVINGNYAIGAGLDLADAAYVEQLSEGYYNVIAVQGADADAEFAQAVKGIVQSDAFKSVIDDPDNIFAGFGKPSSY